MPIRVRCTCGTELQVRDEHVGKSIKCPKCGTVLKAEAAPAGPAAVSPEAVTTAPAPPAPAQPVPPPPAEAPEDAVTTEASPPRSGRRRRDDDDDDAPRRPRQKSSSSTVWIILAAVFVPLCGCGLIGAALLIPAVSKVREAAARTQSANNMKQLGLAIHAYHDANRKLPAANNNGLSWRVAILPYVEQAHLYQQFNQNEPWDSPANRPLLERMPKVFENPQRPAPPGHTFYQAVVGPRAFFSGPNRGFRDITDGLSNTLMLVEGADAVPWTKPADVVYDENGQLPPIGDRGRFLGLYGDISIGRFTSGRIDDSLRTLLTANGNEQPRFDLDDTRGP